MKKKFLVWTTILTLLVAAIGGAVLAGYYIRDRGATPIADILPHIERKLRDLQGLPSERETRLAVLETTFVQLRGTLMRPPDIGWTNGGALTVRGDDLIIMDRRGQLYVTDGTSQIQRLDGIRPPDNGLDVYVAFSESPEGQSYSHNPVRIRFNDVTWVESPALVGLALSYTFYDASRECYGTRIAFADMPSDSALGAASVSQDDWRIVFETRPCLPLNRNQTAIQGQMAGGRTMFEAPSTLYLASGEYQMDGIHDVDAGIQSDASSYGKILAIDLVTGSDRIVSRGHRNMQGITQDKDGRLWVVEHGIRGGDELNLVEDGGNYGWPDTTLGTLYSGQPVPEITYGRHDVGRAPVFAWLPSTAISALTVLDGIDPAWDGDLLAGSLSSPDFGQSLWRIRVDGDRVVFAERIRLGERVRYLTQFGDKIAAWLDSNDLLLFDVTRRGDPLRAVRQHLADTVSPDMTASVESVLGSCNECHSFAENQHRAGPSLNGIVGRAVAATSYPTYSDALTALGGRWTKERLVAYLVDPQAVAPGTSMPESGLRKGAILDALLDALAVLDDTAKPDLTYD